MLNHYPLNTRPLSSGRTLISRVLVTLRTALSLRSRVYYAIREQVGLRAVLRLQARLREHVSAYVRMRMMLRLESIAQMSVLDFGTALVIVKVPPVPNVAYVADMPRTVRVPEV